MASGENVLWIVSIPGKNFIFRTRAAARAFQEKKNKYSKRYWYSDPHRATWGPEQ